MNVADLLIALVCLRWLRHSFRMGLWRIDAHAISSPTAASPATECFLGMRTILSAMNTT